jgi:hypothetical protein
MQKIVKIKLRQVNISCLFLKRELKEVEKLSATDIIKLPSALIGEAETLIRCWYYGRVALFRISTAIFVESTFNGSPRR